MSDRRFYLVVDGKVVDRAFLDLSEAMVGAAKARTALGARRVDVMSEPWPMPHEGEHHRVYSVGVVR